MLFTHEAVVVHLDKGGCVHMWNIIIGYICRLQVAFISTQRLDDRKLEHLFFPQCFHSASFKPLGNLNSNPQGFYSA